MAPIFLDGRTSQNASTANSINVATTNSYVLWAQVGLNVSAANASIPLRVQFDGITTLKLNSAATNNTNLIEIKVVRGTDPNATAVYSGIKTLVLNGSENGPQEYTFGASDYNPPKGNGLLVYSVFVKNITGSNESDVKRVGPESFNALAIGN
ncbi:hypothetical protein [Priestia megaterium]|uniref:hypothetical protein n=1 Tax=Priestia megaterium TaxID=1404 RepID=UPI000BFC8418|nr:hypothetical protein [Priestia megaterium]PGX77758.1 hypothetical protein COE31_12135 [Priestia megaterium]